MSKKINGTILRTVVFTITILVATYMAINDSQNDGYRFNFIIPLTFGIIYSFFKGITRYCNYPGMFFLNIVMIFRYVVTPLISSIGAYNIWRGVVPNSLDISLSILLMLYELIMISFTINIFGNRFYKSNEQKVLNTVENGSISIIYLIIVIAVIAIIFVHPNVLQEYIFIINFEETKLLTEDIPLIGLWRTLVEFVRLLFIVTVLTKCKKAYDKERNSKYIVISMLTIMMNMCFSSGLSRWSVVVPGFILIFILTKLYPNHRAKIVFSTGFIFFFILATISAKKFISVEATILGFNETNIGWWADALQMYFSGPKNIAIGSDTKDILDKLLAYSSLEIFLNDMFSNVAVLNKFTDDSIKSVFYFNRMYYGQIGVEDQIIPMLSQSSIYFGFLFSPLLSCISIMMMMWCDFKAKGCNDIMKFYIFTFAAINFSRAIMLNWTIISANFINNFCIFMAIYKLNSIIKLKKA